MSTEIELKYRLDENLAQQLLRQRHLGPYALTTFSATGITDSYLDTPEKHLARSGYALRLRRKKNDAALQLKSLSPATGALHRRRELIIPDAQDANPDHWPVSPETRFLRQLSGGQPLQELFTIHQKRHEANVLDEQGLPFALLSLDEVIWMAGKKKASAWEMEIELLPEGDESKLLKLADELQKEGAMHPQIKSKFERGLALLDSSE